MAINRLESLEDLMNNVINKLNVIESSQPRVNAQQVLQPTVQEVQVSATSQLQVPVAGESQNGTADTVKQPDYAAVLAAGLGLSFAQHPARHLLNNKVGRNSSKRSVSGAIRDKDGNTEDLNEDVFTDVVRKKKRKEVSMGKATLNSIPGVSLPLQASYQHFVGNTPGNMGKDTLETVLRELSSEVMREKGLEGTLEIEECNLLTKEENTRTRVWRVVVPNKHKEILKDDRIYPSGWHHREFEGNFRPPLTASTVWFR